MSVMHSITQRARFQDADAWCEAINDWNLDFRQLDAGPLEATIERVLAPDLALQRVSLSRRFHQQGVAPPGVTTFGIPLGSAPVHWFGQDADESRFMNFNHRDGFDAVSETDFSALTVSLATRDLDQTLRAMGSEQGAAPLADGPALYGRVAEQPGVLIELVTALMAAMQSPEPQGSIIRELRSQLRFTLAKAILDEGPSKRRTGTAQRKRAVEEAVAMIRYAPDMPLIEEVHQACGVSYRTLHRGFRDRFGISPKQYLLRARLSAARQALLQASPGASVTGIASDIGFWHLGRFARAYDGLFQEKPSATLARGQRRQRA